MIEALTKTYVIDGKTIDIRFKPKVVSIDCTSYTSKKDLLELFEACKKLISQVKDDYNSNFGKELKISNRSFIAEIWGHLVAYKISIWLKKNIKISIIQQLAKFTAHRSGIVDCGEAKVDSNRWVWDVIGWAFFNNFS